MFTFTMLAGASATLIASGVADKVLKHYEKQDLAETLRLLTHVGAVGYVCYFASKLLITVVQTFL